MCGRFLTPEQSAFERYWGLEAPAGYFRSFNVAPSQAAAVIRMDPDGAARADLLRWGFQPPWAKRAWINARSETVFTTNAFASAARRRRCLVPAIGWYEWQGSAAPKRPHVFHRAGFAPFAFAGIWTGRETEQGWEHSFAILTKPAPEALVEYHTRMPVVLEQAEADAWLSTVTETHDAEGLLGRAAEAFAAYPVSRYVNKPEHDDPRCIEPLNDEAADS